MSLYIYPFLQCDCTFREPASDQSSLCTVLPAQQENLYHQKMKQDLLLAQAGSQSEQPWI